MQIETSSHAPEMGKGRRATNTTTPMQTGGDATARRQRQQAPSLTPRHRRALLALLEGPRTREDIDRITGASNGPDEIQRIRRRFSLAVPCQRRGTKDRDGRHVEFGIYSLTENDRANVLKLLEVHP